MALPTTTNVTNPRQWGYEALLGSTYLRLATAPDRQTVVQSAPLQAARVDTTSNSEEVSNEYGLLFSRNDFTGGSGLARAHKADSQDIDARRYYDSKNVDITDDGTLTLLQTVEELDASTSDPIYVAHTDGSVWYTDNQTLQKSTNPTAATPTFSADDPHNGESATDVTGLATLGTTVYAALNANGIHRLQSGGAWAHWSDLTARRIWSAKGLILADDGNGDLYQAASGAGSTALVTGVDDMVWNDVTDASQFVLACASDGNIYALSFDGTNLSLEAQSFLEGEEPTAISSLFNQVIIATEQQISATEYRSRLYTATLTSSGVLDSLNLVEEWEGTDVRICGLNTSLRTSAYFGLPDAGNGETHLWRYDWPTGGLHRYFVATTGEGCVQNVLAVQDRLWWGINGQGVQRNTTDYASTGYVIGPLADFFTSDDKSWAGLRAGVNALPDDTTVELARAGTRSTLDTPSSGWIPVTQITSINDDAERLLNNINQRSLAVQVTLNGAADVTVTPEVESYTVRAYPGEGDLRVSLQVNVSDQVARFGKNRSRVPNRGSQVFDHLLTLAGTATSLTLLKEGLTLDGTVEQVSQPISTITPRGSSMLVSTVVFRGRESSVGDDVSIHTWGSGQWGQGLWGLPGEEIA